MDFEAFKQEVIVLTLLANSKLEEAKETSEDQVYWQGYQDGVRVLWVYMNDKENPVEIYEDPFSKCYQTDHPAIYGMPCAIEPTLRCTPDCPDCAHYSEDNPMEMR